MSETKYRQVRIQLGTTEQVAFIPEKFAKLNAFLELRGENGWKVVEVFGRSYIPGSLVFNERDLRKDFGSLQ